MQASKPPDAAPTLLSLRHYWQYLQSLLPLSMTYQTRGQRSLNRAFNLQNEIETSTDLEAILKKTIAAVDDLDRALGANRELENTLGVKTFVTDTLAIAASQLVREGERYAVEEKWESAHAYLGTAYDLNDLFDGYSVPVEIRLYVWIEGGDFIMGSEERSEYERPVRSLYVPGFWIMRTEVTTTHYRECIEADVCSDDLDYFNYQIGQANWPVSGINWNQAQTFAVWLGGRLPTEAEWEKACRGANGDRYPWGNSEPSTSKLNYYDSEVGSPHDVGRYPPGKYGLYDMAGNVAEWTISKYRWYPYFGDDGRESLDNEPEDRRVARGSAWSIEESKTYCAFRNSEQFDAQPSDFGFRVVIPMP